MTWVSETFLKKVNQQKHWPIIIGIVVSGFLLVAMTAVLIWFLVTVYFTLPVLKISVPKRTAIVASSSGKIQRRRLKADGTPENVPMYPYEITTRLSSLRLLDFSAQPVPDSTCDDLDPVERERLRNIIRSYHGEVQLLDLSNEELDRALQFVTMQNGQLVPTLCGLLMIGKAPMIQSHVPTAEASIQVLSGTDIKVNESFHLPLLAAFDKINSTFTAWNSSEEMEVGLFRISIPSYEPRAFREALVNAFCHRLWKAFHNLVLCEVNSYAKKVLVLSETRAFFFL